MTIKDIKKFPIITKLLCKRNAFIGIFSRKKKVTTTKETITLPANMPKELKDLFSKINSVLTIAFYSSKYDIPFFGDRSDWAMEQHLDLLESIYKAAKNPKFKLEGRKYKNMIIDLVEGYSIYNDNEDYFHPQYGADGDFYQIEEEFKISKIDASYGYELSLFDAIRWGG